MSVLELDTASLHGPEKIGLWADAITRAFGPFGISCSDPARFRGRLKVERRGDIRFVELGYSGHVFSRSAGDVSRLSDTYFSLLRPTSGRLRLAQGGTEHVLEPGRYYVVNHSVPYESRPESGYRTTALAFPPTALASRVARPQPFYALPDPATSPRMALLVAFLREYAAGRQSWSEAEFPLLTNQLLDLVALTLAETGQGVSTSETAARAARRAEAMAFIRDNLARRDLTPRTVAAACGISLAYLHEIFRAAPLGVEETIVAERLERARHRLRAPEGAGEQIATIAYRVGFADPAHFTRAFRRRFGVSPREWRQGEGESGA